MKALIFGVTGQDGSYLADLLLGKGYEVVGVARRSSQKNTIALEENGALFNEKFSLVNGDITDAGFVHRLIGGQSPHEVYNLAAQSHVGISFEEPSHTSDVVYRGCLNCLEAIRAASPSSKFYQASSSEMFGSSYTTRNQDGELEHRDGDGDGFIAHYCYQDELTPMLPCSPYAVAKLAAHHLCSVYRRAYGLFASCGILYNHESPKRGEQFVTRKITRHIASIIAYGESAGPLRLGNLEAKRDWGYAPDYVKGMWAMLQQEKPDDYVLATGETHSVGEFLHTAADSLVSREDRARLFRSVVIDPALYRPCEVRFLRGSAAKAEAQLGWKPETNFRQLVQIMLRADISRLCGWGKVNDCIIPV